MTTVIRKAGFITLVALAALALVGTATKTEARDIAAYATSQPTDVIAEAMANIETVVRVGDELINGGAGEFAKIRQRTYRGAAAVADTFTLDGPAYTEEQFLYGSRVTADGRSAIGMWFITGDRPVYLDTMADGRRIQRIRANESVGELRRMVAAGDFPILNTAHTMRDLHLGLTTYRWTELTVMGDDLLLTGENGLYESAQVRLGLQQGVLVPLSLEVRRGSDRKVHIFEMYRRLTTGKVRPLKVTLVDFRRKIRSVSELLWINIYPAEGGSHPDRAAVERLAKVMND